MKSRLIALIVVALVFTGSTAAQNWFGVRSGYPLGVTLHYGIGNGLGAGADLRISGRLVASGDSVRVGVGADALWNVFSEEAVNAYVGAGPAFEVGSSYAALDIQGLAGAQFRFAPMGLPRLGVFVEASLGASLNLTGERARIPTFGAAVGFNWYF